MTERQDSLDLLLSCVVCLEEFEEDGGKIPRLLPCTHTLCENCIKQLICNQQLECPECRAKHEAKNEEKSFPQNKYLLMQIRKRSAKSSEEKVPQGYERCKDHGKELSLFCQETECQRVICQTCLTKYHKKHDVVELEEEIKKTVIAKVHAIRRNFESKMRLISSAKEDIQKKTEESMKELKRKQDDINRQIEEMMKKAMETKRESDMLLDDELSAMNVNLVLLDGIQQNIQHKDTVTLEEIVLKQETVKEIYENNIKHFSGTRHFRYLKVSKDKHTIESLENAVLAEDITIDLNEEINMADLVFPIPCSVNWTTEIGIRVMSAITLLSDNRVAVCGKNVNGTQLVECYDMRIGKALDHAEFKNDARAITEVKLAGRLALAVSYLNEKYIEFRATENLSEIIYNHSVAPHHPGRLSTYFPSILLYEDRSKELCNIHWLDCSKDMPRLLKEKSLTTPLQKIWDLVRVDELVIEVEGKNGIRCYNTNTKSLKWSMAGNPQGMQNVIDATGVTADGNGHLIVGDYLDGNRCIQMFSLSDGQYLGCLIKEGEQALGCPFSIRWHSASQSLAVVHYNANDKKWFLSMIKM